MLTGRKMLKIDVNKSGRIFDFLVSAGILRLSYDPSAKGIGPGKEGHVIHPNGHANGANGAADSGYTRPGVTEVVITGGHTGTR
jgi:transcriptional adapter 2-alpha